MMQALEVSTVTPWYQQNERIQVFLFNSIRFTSAAHSCKTVINLPTIPTLTANTHTVYYNLKPYKNNEMKRIK